MLHATDDVDELRASAKRQAPALGDALRSAVDAVPGAEIEAVRDAKDADRIEDKAARQGVAPSQVGDIAAAKATVPDQEAAEQVLQHLDATMPVKKAEGAVTGEPGKNGVRQVQATVRTPAAGKEPVKHAEVLLQTPEMNAATDKTHDAYKHAQQLRADGKGGEASTIEKGLEATHERAEQQAQKRLAEEKPQETKYKFGNTQANIDDNSPAGRALTEYRGRIPDSELAGDGKDVGEGGNHVTVRYGIDGDDTAGIEQYLAAQKPFTARLGETEVFPPSKHSDGAAVLTARVEAPELHRMNDEIQQHGKFAPSDFKDYKPHATIAYIKPERASAYGGMQHLKGKQFPVRSVTIADRNGNQREVQLGGVDTPASSFKAGRQSTPVMVKDVTGNWVNATLDHWNPGFNGAKQSGRVTLENGMHVSSVTADRLRPSGEEQQQPAKSGSWIAVDLDGTLAHYDGFKGAAAIGKPVPAMVSRVKKWLADGKDVRILTARVSDDPQGAARKAIDQWTAQHIGQKLPVTDVKDDKMVKLYDDRAVTVEKNTGKIVTPKNA